MKKILSMALVVLMLSALAVPAMAEDEVTVLDLNVKEVTFSYHSDETNGNDLSTNIEVSDADAAVSDRVFETGFSVKTSGGTSSNDYFYLQTAGKSKSYPILNAKFMYDSEGKVHSIKVSGSDSTSYVFEDGEWNDGWNDIKFVVKLTSYTLVNEALNAPFVIDMYINAVLVNTFTGEYKVSSSASVEHMTPYRLKAYKTTTGSDSLSVNVNDIYIAKYNSVTTFTQETVTASATVGQEVTLPSTVNVAVDGTVEAVSVTWADVDTTTSGTKTVTGVVSGYTNSDASDVTVTATVTVTEPKYAYELAIDGTTLTVAKAGTLNPEAKVYGAVYEDGLLKEVQLLGTVSGDTDWTDGSASFTLDDGKTYRAFVIDDDLVPYAVSTALN